MVYALVCLHRDRGLTRPMVELHKFALPVEQKSKRLVHRHYFALIRFGARNVDMSLEHNHGTEIELNERSPHPVLSAESEQQVYPVLKPTDGGRHAWQALIAAFFFEALLWGEISSRRSVTAKLMIHH